jgi:hypothetical protein
LESFDFLSASYHSSNPPFFYLSSGSGTVGPLQVQFQGTQSHPTLRTKEMLDLVGVDETESSDILGTQMGLLYQPLMLDECGTLLE